MCPLRFILIFLSATLAGFFVLRNLKSQPQDFEAADDNSDAHSNDSSAAHSSNSTSKVLVILSYANGIFHFLFFSLLCVNDRDFLNRCLRGSGRWSTWPAAATCGGICFRRHRLRSVPIDDTSCVLPGFCFVLFCLG